MGYPTNQTSLQTKPHFLKLLTSGIGLVFLFIGLGLTIGLALAGYNFLSQPEHFTSLMEYAKTQENLFVKWTSGGDLTSIELSNTFTLILIVIAICMVLRVVIGFISMCVSSGKALLNSSRNFD